MMLRIQPMYLCQCHCTWKLYYLTLMENHASKIMANMKCHLFQRTRRLSIYRENLREFRCTVHGNRWMKDARHTQPNQDPFVFLFPLFIIFIIIFPCCVFEHIVNSCLFGRRTDSRHTTQNKYSRTRRHTPCMDVCVCVSAVRLALN